MKIEGLIEKSVEAVGRIARDVIVAPVKIVKYGGSFIKEIGTTLIEPEAARQAKESISNEYNFFRNLFK